MHCRQADAPAVHKSSAITLLSCRALSPLADMQPCVVLAYSALIHRFAHPLYVLICAFGQSYADLLSQWVVCFMCAL
jgi:hypothetical protein